MARKGFADFAQPRFHDLATDGRQEPIVAIVTDDRRLIAKLGRLIAPAGLAPAFLASAAELQIALRVTDPNCIIMSSRLPDRSGLRLYEDMQENGLRTPVIFISGDRDIRAVARAMKKGAVDFFGKSYNEHEMLEAIQDAVALDRQRRIRDKIVREFRARFDTLTPREREMLDLMASGRTTKQIAAVLGITSVTAKTHRNQVMKKMTARTTVDIVNMAMLLQARIRNTPPARP